MQNNYIYLNYCYFTQFLSLDFLSQFSLFFIDFLLALFCSIFFSFEFRFFWPEVPALACDVRFLGGLGVWGLRFHLFPWMADCFWACSGTLTALLLRQLHREADNPPAIGNLTLEHQLHRFNSYTSPFRTHLCARPPTASLVAARSRSAPTLVWSPQLRNAHNHILSRLGPTDELSDTATGLSQHAPATL